MSSAYPPPQGYNPNTTNASSVDDLISAATREPDDIDELIRMAEAGIKPPKKSEPAPVYYQAPPPTQAPQQPTVPEPAVAPEVSEKKTKKEKDKNSKMVYSDNEISPEEKMARMPRYAFAPDGKNDVVLVEEAQPGVAGAVDDQAQ
jgi:hypothetical protein